MLDALYNDQVSVRRLAGPRDGHGKPTLVVVTEALLDPESDSDVPLYVECFVDRKRRMTRTATEQTKTVDATLYYTVDDAPVVLRDEDLVVVQSTGETFKVTGMQEQALAADGVVRALVFLARTKFAVAPNAAGPDDV